MRKAAVLHLVKDELVLGDILTWLCERKLQFCYLNQFGLLSKILQLSHEQRGRLTKEKIYVMYNYAYDNYNTKAETFLGNFRMRC